MAITAEEIARKWWDTKKACYPWEVARYAWVKIVQEVLDAANVPALEARLKGLEGRFTAPIVCMCGSTRFKQTWIAENARLTGEGYIVLAVGLWGHHERVFPAPDVKAKLDDLHKRKIDLCDWVWVLNVGGYIGDSTKSEIAYAITKDKPVRYLSQEFPGYQEPADPLLDEVERLREALGLACKWACKHNNSILCPDGGLATRCDKNLKRDCAECWVDYFVARAALGVD